MAIASYWLSICVYIAKDGTGKGIFSSLFIQERLGCVIRPVVPAGLNFQDSVRSSS